MSEKWTMRGLDECDSKCLTSADDLARFIGKVGFLPLFRNEAEGFSVEEHVPARYWWTDDEQKDPWCWRMKLAEDENIAYGKFFDGKAGFIAKEWFPFFASLRRDGYDFDARADEGKARPEEIRIMSLLEQRAYCDTTYLKTFSELKTKFDGTMTRLMYASYVIVNGFTQRVNKSGQPFGWHIATYMKPEIKWGYDYVTSAYSKQKEEMKFSIINKLSENFPKRDFDKIMSFNR